MTLSKNTLSWGIRFLISFLFLLSAVAKLYPSPYFAISTFEVKQLYPMGFSDSFAPYFSRILIGIEFALGLLILQKNFLRGLVIPATVLLLAVFTSHLTIVTFVSGGNSGNCGCFGSLLPMTPIQAIVKNVAALLLLCWLYIILPKSIKIKGNFWVVTTVTFASILALFMVAPMQPVESKFTISEPEEITVDSLVINSKKVQITPVIIKDSANKVGIEKELTKAEFNEPSKKNSGYSQYFSKIDNGRKTLCFFVPGCDHCRVAARELTELRKTNKNFPEISIIFMNEEADLIPIFFKEAGAEYPYKIIEVIPFWKVLGSGKDTPGVKYLWNGNEYKYYWGIEDNKFDALDYQNLFNKSYSELKK
jgi:hypothetical protein